MTCGIELRRIEVPLLARVVAEELLVQLPPDLADDDVLGRLDRRSRFSATDSKNLSSSNEVSFSPYNRLTVSRLIGIGSELAVHPRLDAVLVRPPLREPRQVLEDRRFEFVWKMCGPYLCTRMPASS